MRKVFMPDPMSRDNRRPLRNIVYRCPGCNWHVRDIELRAPQCYLCDKDTVPIEEEEDNHAAIKTDGRNGTEP